MERKFVATCAVVITAVILFGFAMAHDSGGKNESANGPDEPGITFIPLPNPPDAAITDPIQQKQRFAAIDAEVHRLFARSQSLVEVDRFLTTNGFVKVSHDKEFPSISSTVSLPEHVKTAPPSVYYDYLTGKYRISASYAWKKDPDNGTFGWQVDPSYGGLDAFGFYINATGTNYLQNVGGGSFTMYYSDGSLYDTSSKPAASNKTGIVFTAQDFVRNGKFNMNSGYVEGYFTVGKTGASQYEICSKYVHTYANAKIKKIGVSSTGINISWRDDEGAAWTAASPNPLYWTP